MLDRKALSSRIQQSLICATFHALIDRSTTDLCTIYSSTLCHILYLAPAKPINIKQRPHSSWFDSDFRKARTLVRSFEWRYRRTKSPNDLILWKEQLEVKRLLLAQKETAYWTATISACNGNSKRLWGYLNAIMLRDTDFGPSQPAVTADSLSKYFVSKVEAIRALTLHYSQPTFIPRRHVDLQNEFSPCSLDEVRRTIQCSTAK